MSLVKADTIQDVQDAVYQVLSNYVGRFRRGATLHSVAEYGIRQAKRWR